MRLEEPGLENRDVHRRDPFGIMFLNAGVKNMTNALTAEEHGAYEA